MPLSPWMKRLPNRGALYEWLVLDNLPAGMEAVARGGRDSPFDLLVREPEGVFAWEVKGNELDARGAFTERRRFSATARQVAWIDANRARVRFAFLWIDPARDRFGFRVLPAARVSWKSPASPKYVLPPQEAFALDLDLSRYRAASSARRLAARWRALPEARDIDAFRSQLV